jgi:hypothetical protein
MHKAGLFDEVIVNDDFQVTVNAFFRLMRDWYVVITCVQLDIFEDLFDIVVFATDFAFHHSSD